MIRRIGEWSFERQRIMSGSVERPAVIAVELTAP